MALPALVSPQGWRVICTSDMGHYRPPIGDHFRGCCGRLLVLVFGLISGLTTGVALVSEALAGEAVRNRLKDECAQAIARGVFGSPFVIIDGEPFWGVDRIPQIERWLQTGGF